MTITTESGAARKEPRWLSPGEDRTWRAYLQASELIGDHLDRQLQRDSGIPHVYYGLLAWLSEAPGRQMRMTDLAEQSQITRSRLSHAIARLEERGWVRRANCAWDKRGQIATLTDEGFAFLEKAAPGHVEAVREAVFDALTPEQVEAFGAACTAIAARLNGSPAVPWHR
ncbi:MAG: MarR family transcriptional regulator [Hamadaea sp.]|nr:MarR family transcriptional regulator [Hamadaea sp.]